MSVQYLCNFCIDNAMKEVKTKKFGKKNLLTFSAEMKMERNVQFLNEPNFRVILNNKSTCNCKLVLGYPFNCKSVSITVDSLELPLGGGGSVCVCVGVGGGGLCSLDP